MCKARDALEGLRGPSAICDALKLGFLEQNCYALLHL